MPGKSVVTQCQGNIEKDLFSKFDTTSFLQIVKKSEVIGNDNSL